MLRIVKLYRHVVHRVVGKARRRMLRFVWLQASAHPVHQNRKVNASWLTPSTQKAGDVDVVPQTLYRHPVQFARLAHKRFANSGYGSHCPQSAYYLGCNEAVDLVDQSLIKRIPQQRPPAFKKNIRIASRA